MATNTAMIRILIGLVLGTIFGIYVDVSYPHAAKAVLPHFQ
jgi:hypothetical protein